MDGLRAHTVERIFYKWFKNQPAFTYRVPKAKTEIDRFGKVKAIKVFTGDLVLNLLQRWRKQGRVIILVSISFVNESA